MRCLTRYVREAVCRAMRACCGGQGIRVKGHVGPAAVDVRTERIDETKEAFVGKRY